jgi:hypothetical protein
MRSFGLPELLIIILVGVILIKIVNARAAAGRFGPRPQTPDGFPPSGFCTKCGQPLTPGGAFCPFCGSRQG